MTPSDHPDAGFADRMLAESVRALEHDGARPIEDDAANARAVEAGGDFEQRITRRAAELQAAGPLREALRHTTRVIVMILVAAMVLAAMAGASAARASLGSEGPVNIFWALGGLLGIQTLLLGGWLLILLKGPQALSGASLGGAVLGLGRRLAARWQTGASGAAAIEAAGAVFARGAIGRWTLSAISHGLWVVFNAVCLLLIVLMLSARHYRFVWETTILSADTYVDLTRGLAWLPQRLGFPTPSADQITASEGSAAPDDSEPMRHAWSGLLVGSIVTYGLAPRLLLFVVSLAASSRARRRYRLDTNHPGYLRLRPRLLPRTEWLGVIDPDTEIEADTGPSSAPRQRTHAGPPAVLGLEIERPATPWPPRVAGVTWRDLGFVDDRADRQRILGALAGEETTPPVIVTVCGLTSTPDRGLAAFLGQVGEVSGARLALVLTGGEAFRRRGDAAQLATRVEDWHALATGAGIEPDRIVEVDLDHLTDASAAGLAALLGADAATPHAGGRHIEAAFDLIVEHMDRWPDTPDPKHQAQLHEAIGGVYRSVLPSWRQRLGTIDLEADVAAPLRQGAQSVVSLLPPRLRTESRWLVAGAAAGALGCLAAATVLSPAAIAALPAWSALGAAVTAAVRAVAPRSTPEATAAGAGGRGDAVRSAALFALLLELQGHDETTITRILDRVVEADDAGAIGDVAGARRWLDGLRHRLDLALAAEAAS